MKLRVVTYNIRLGIQEGVAAVADVLTPEAPDIVAVQEVGRNWIMGPEGYTAARLAALLELDHYVFVPSLTQGAAHYGHALLSRFPLVRADFFRLVRDRDEPRTILDAQVETPHGTVRIVSTHLSHVDDRPRQGEQLVGAAHQFPKLPTLVMGDLNATHEAFIEELHGMCVDADPLARPTFPASDPERRIDYILARDGELTDTVIGENSTASDHRYVASTWHLFG